MEGVTRVLVVDDSAYVRKVVSEMLARSPSLEVVGTARDGLEALELVAELRPDVVTCDLMMPRMDGVEFVRTQMKRRPVPVVIMSVVSENGDLVLSALEAGAVDFVRKPTALATEKIYDVAAELVAKVKAAAGVPIARLRRLPSTTPSAPVAASPLRTTERVRIIVLGVSTGGPQALRLLIPQLPANLPVPVAMVLHMPVGYTELYAHKLNELSALDVVEAKEGDPVQAGRVFLAPAGRHLTFRRDSDGRVVTHLDVKPLDTLHRPAVDVLFQSAAEVFGSGVLGVVMTGMGSDGKEGAAWIKGRGGLVLTEAEETCIVYGMPRAVVEAGLSDGCVTLDRIAAALLERL